MMNYTDMTPEELAEARGDIYDPDADNDNDNDTPPVVEGDDDPQLGDDEPGSRDEPPATGDEPPQEDDGDEPLESKDGGGYIPKARFNEVINQKNEFKQQLELLQKQNELLMEMLQKGGGAVTQQQQPEQQHQTDPEAEKWKDFDYDKVYKDWNEAVYDGDMDEALELRKQLDEYLVWKTRQETLESVNQTLQTQSLKQQEIEGQKVAQQIYERHKDWFDEDESNVDVFIATRQAFQKKGLSLAEALKKAEEKWFGSSQQKQQQKGEDARQQASKRTQEQLKRNANAMQQPPAKGGYGNRDEKGYKNALEIPEKEWQQMSEAEKAKLRGDII